MQKNQPESEPNRIRQALNRIYEGQPAHFQEYLRRYQQDPKSRIFAPLAEAYRKQGDVDEAIDICKEGLNHHPDFSSGRVTLARCYMDKKFWAEAKRELLYVVERVPENLLAQKLLGEIFQNEGNKTEALRCYKLALVQSPGDTQLASLVERLELDTSAEAASRTLNARDSEWSTHSPGETEMGASIDGEFLSAEVEKEPNIELVPNVTPDGRIEMVPFDPTDHEEHVNRILGFEDNGDDKEPFRVEHVSALFAEKPQDRTEITTQTLGDLYFSQGQYDKSLKIYERIASVHPSPEISRKIDACRVKLGVAEESLEREKKIQKLRGILNKVQN